MISSRKDAAIRLRQTGRSIKSIAQQLNAAQSSVSLWVRDVTLTEKQILALRANTHNPQTIEKRRQSRLKNELAKRNAVLDRAVDMVDEISERELWLIGTALYWAEGGKTKGIVRFSNGDPRMIRLMIRFFAEVCHVDESKMRAHIHIHDSLDCAAAEAYWRKVTNMPKEKFYKTYNKPNVSSKGTRKSLPYGVCDIYVLDANLLLNIQGWTDGICKRTIGQQNNNHAYNLEARKESGKSKLSLVGLEGLEPPTSAM